MLDAAAVEAVDPLLVAARLDLAALRRSGEIPPLLSALVQAGRANAPARRTVGAPAAGGDHALAGRLAALSPAEQQDVLQDLVMEQAALVLGMSGPDIIEAGRTFRDVGFDSLTAVELRNRLNSATGLHLPATAVFDYPTPTALAEFLAQEMLGSTTEETTALSAYSGLDKLEASITEIIGDDTARTRVTARLKDILTLLNDAGGPSEVGDDGDSVADKIQSASDDDMFDFIDNQLGI
ncbi:acyl carrier protein [Streptomyces griseochromogenes]|uniref:Acyl carrier protein n=1 Tax=Streptomyces griseochromogenes TaxID=68214 RepID=A0ABS4MAY7_9ACTN|nr:acyl carrier protein [Streptomyces griseochromogenes]